MLKINSKLLESTRIIINATLPKICQAASCQKKNVNKFLYINLNKFTCSIMSETANVQKPEVAKTKNYKIQAAAFLGLVGGISAIFGFSKTLTKAKRNDEAKLIAKQGREAIILLDEGSALALRALGWGTLYAVLGTGIFCYGVWKLSGANNMQEFRMKMGKSLPRLTKDEPATSRTEFDGLTDLMKYLAAWGKE